MNQNYKTDAEFENFLLSIGGLKNGYMIEDKPILSRGYFSVSNGWLGIVQSLIEVLIKLGWNKEIIQVKEKFGGLRFYVNNLPDNAIFFITDSEKKSYNTCEVCGEPGEQHKIKGWINTLCYEHTDNKLYVEYEGKTYLKKLIEPILKGDYYYNAITHEVLFCNTDKFFDPWSLKVVEKLK